MSANGTTTGAHTSLAYLWEDDGFGQEPADTDHKPFGADASLNTAEGSNNAVQVFEPASRQAIDVIEQNFSGSWSVQFTLTNPWWLGFVFGAPTSDTSTHTFAANGDPEPGRIYAGYEKSGSTRELQGCVPASISISATVPDRTTVTIQGAYAREELDTANAVEQPPVTNRAMTFAHSELRIGGSTQALVQDVTLNLQAQVDLINELGSRFAVDYSPKALSPTVDFTAMHDSNHDELEEMYGGASQAQEVIDNKATLELLVDNGLDGEDMTAVSVEMAGSITDSYGEQGIGNPQADVQKQINRIATEVSAEATTSEAAR